MASEPKDPRRKHRLVRWTIIGAVAVAGSVATVGAVVGIRSLGDAAARREPVTAAFHAAEQGDLAAFRSRFDRLPAGVDVSGFLETVQSRYGAFATARRTGAWSAPSGRHISTARFRLEFAKASVDADVTSRTLVEEASATGDTSYLGRSRLVRIVIRDSGNGDLSFP